jgi:hypothetical protein
MLQDRLEITQLVAQYGPNIDSGAGEQVAQLWTEDGRFDALPYRRMQGRGQIAAMVTDPRHEEMLARGCGHFLSAPHIVIEGDQAMGRSHALQLRWDAASERYWVVRLSANQWRWERTAQGWRIAERIVSNLDGTPGGRELLAPQTRRTGVP